MANTPSLMAPMRPTLNQCCFIMRINFSYLIVIKNLIVYARRVGAPSRTLCVHSTRSVETRVNDTERHHENFKSLERARSLAISLFNGVLIDRAVFHDHDKVFVRIGDEVEVFKRIAVHQNQIGQRPFFDHA